MSKGRKRRPKPREGREEGIEKMDQGRKVQGKEEEEGMEKMN